MNTSAFAKVEINSSGYATVSTDPSSAFYLVEALKAKIRNICHKDDSDFMAAYRALRMCQAFQTDSERVTLSREDAEIVGKIQNLHKGGDVDALCVAIERMRPSIRKDHMASFAGADDVLKSMSDVHHV